MPAEIVEPDPDSLFHPGRAREVALLQHKRLKAFGYAKLATLVILAIRGMVLWGWFGLVCLAAIWATVGGTAVVWEKLLVVRLRAARGDAGAFVIAFAPLDPSVFKRLRYKEIRRYSFQATLQIHFGRLDIRPWKRDRPDLSVPVDDIRAVVIHRYRAFPRRVMVFIEVEGEGVLRFQLLSRDADLATALRAAGVPGVEDL
ncbi:hypothetical protein ACIBG8_09265 [Nonomuraea sp. NPDC050556]|uniref:hypothetical protein n=1 Tax=Nonomuraea sp. NPDC050556 TaxID=3364369 RepID=UPI0037905112